MNFLGGPTGEYGYREGLVSRGGGRNNNSSSSSVGVSANNIMGGRTMTVGGSSVGTSSGKPGVTLATLSGGGRHVPATTVSYNSGGST